MSVTRIVKLENLLNLPKDKKILKYEVKRLTAPGENYCSIILSVDLMVQSGNETDKIHLVAKLVPPVDFVQEIANTQVTFRNEIEFYKTIVPLIQNFQRENGVADVIDFAPKYYGSRFNLTGSDKIDLNGALVLENLKVQNYQLMNRMEGVDLDIAQLILSNLASLHAACLGLKLKKPDVFEKQVKPFLDVWIPRGNNFIRINNAVAALVDEIQSLKPLKERILGAFSRYVNDFETREPFATVTHNDCWTNNAMVKFEGSTPVKVKLVDYQHCSYGSPARDIILFIFSSVKTNIIQKHYDDMLKNYYNTFISVLKGMKCDTSAFTFEALLKEIDIEAKNSQSGHVIFILIFILGDQTANVDEFSPDNFIPNKYSNVLKEKFKFVVEEFLKRNWL